MLRRAGMCSFTAAHCKGSKITVTTTKTRRMEKARSLVMVAASRETPSLFRRAIGFLAALGDPIKLEPMIHELETQFLRNAPLELFDVLVDEFDDAAGRYVDQMIVVLADLFITRTPVTKIVTLENAGIFEQLDRAIDRRNRYMRVHRDGAPVQFLGIRMVIGFGDDTRDDAALLRHPQALHHAGLFDAIEIFFYPVQLGLSRLQAAILMETKRHSHGLAMAKATVTSMHRPEGHRAGDNRGVFAPSSRTLP